MKTNVKTMMMALVTTTMVACSNNQDVFDGGAIEKTAKQSYAENFAKKYPNVDMNQNWDFSSKQSDYRIASGNKAHTRAGEGAITKGSWYEVDNNTLAWMHEQLVEGVDNRSLGNPFYMTVPGNDFTIIPIYQGQAGAMWNLHVVVDGVDYLVWEKSNSEIQKGDIQIKDGDSDEWHNLHGGGQSWETWNSLYNTDGSDKWLADGNQNLVTAVRSIPFTFHDFRVGAEMYFYLDVTVSGSGDWDGKYHEINNVGAHESSLKGQMLALQDVPRPANIAEDNEVMIIGCEDADLKDSDWDCNDVVFLVYGKTVPKPIKIEEGDEIEEVKTVRYMIEDLGATDDFDFNDIVVDVTEIRTISPTYTNGVVTKWNEKRKRQEAVIRHLGGILPFVLKIGNTEYAAGGQESFQTSPDLKLDNVTGWTGLTGVHNISVQVQQKDNQDVYNNVVFPKAGEAPMIIAVDPSQGWMTERQSVPESWFYIPE
jgi:hypothetical protein